MVAAGKPSEFYGCTDHYFAILLRVERTLNAEWVEVPDIERLVVGA